MEPMSADSPITKIVEGHFRERLEEQPELSRIRAAHDGKFWDQGHPWKGLVGAVDVKLQVNVILPYVRSFLSNLFYRNPRTEARPPRVRPKKAGRPKLIDNEQVELVQAFYDEFLARPEVQSCALIAYHIALTSHAAAFKVGCDKAFADPGDPLSAVWLDVLPRWEVIFDDRARLWERQRYRGHVRWEPIEIARELLENDLADVDRHALPDHLAPDDKDKGRDESYVQVLEWYDLTSTDRKHLGQRWFLVDGSIEGGEGRGSLTVTEYPKAAKVIPWRWPTGRPAVPIEPVILWNSPELPLKGIPPTRGLYEKAAEKNLLLSLVASGMRLDAARKVVYDKSRLTGDELEEFLERSVDQEFMGVNANGPLTDLFVEVPTPSLAPSLDKYAAWLEGARQDESVGSDLQRGRQGKYLSATEAELLSEYSESTTGEIAKRMDDAIGRVCKLVGLVVADMSPDGLHVQLGGEVAKLSPELLLEPWTLRIIDAASTPVREAQRRQEFMTIQGPLVELAKLASAPSSTPPAQPGAPAPTESEVTPAVAKLAQRMLDYTVQLWQLPAGMSWQALVGEEEEQEAAPLSDEEAQALLGRIAPEAPPAPVPAPVAPAPEPPVVPIPE
jgi:hypothetical protein